MSKYWKPARIMAGGKVQEVYIEADDDGVEYQEKLVSGENIKTINGESILGSGGLETFEPIKIADTEVAVSAWESDDTYEDFPYRAAILIDGVTEDNIAQMSLDVTEALSGSYAPVTLTYDGGVYIFASEIPSDVLTIPSIAII